MSSISSSKSDSSSDDGKQKISWNFVNFSWIFVFSGELSEDTKKIDSTKSKKSSKKPTSKAVISEKPDLTLDESSQGEFPKVPKSSLEFLKVP